MQVKGSDMPTLTRTKSKHRTQLPRKAQEWLDQVTQAVLGPGAVNHFGFGGACASTGPAPALRPAERLRPSIPVLKGVRVPGSGATRSVTGRWMVIYSPIDIHCGCDGHFCIDCTGYDPGDARAIAANIVLSIHLDRTAE